MAEPSAGDAVTGGNDSDQDFDPSAEMLVDEFDDEHTLDEEEALDGPEENDEEIDDLQKEGEMPLEQLLAMYGYAGNDVAPTTKPLEKATVAGITNVHESSNNSNSSSVEQPVSQPSQHSITAVESAEVHSSNLWRLESNPLMVAEQEFDESESEEDENEEAAEDWRRTIQVGTDYQACIPEGLCRYDDVPAYENEDFLLWDPATETEKEIEEFLKQHAMLKALDEELTIIPSDAPALVPIPDTSLPTGSHIRDDQQALYILHQCGHKADEALRRCRMQSQKNGMFDPITSFSEDECRNFEEGLRVYGKDFYLIQKNKVKTRSVGELVQFYYYWKKTERHDVFASKWRIEKKKYSLHPGTTDYMDRFLDEQENLALQTHSLSSPSYTVQGSSRQPHHISMMSSSNHSMPTNTNPRQPNELHSSVVTESVSSIVSNHSVNPYSNGINKSDQAVNGPPLKNICPAGPPETVIPEATLTQQ